MKYKEYELENNKVEYKNSILGKETVIVNGNVVSEKQTLFGASHSFNVNSNQYKLVTKREFTDTLSVIIILTKNGEFVQKDIVSDKNLLIVVLLSGLFFLWLMSLIIV